MAEHLARTVHKPISEADPVAEEIRRVLLGRLDGLAPCRVLVGYSGGMDSSVLLHLVSALLKNGTDFGSVRIPFHAHAVHVHHGLSADADAWEAFCRRHAAQAEIPFTTLRVKVSQDKNQSPEEAARTARYEAFRRFMQSGDVLLLAHQQDDQAETLLLQLLRGSGPQGLAAMPEFRQFARGFILRPMLKLPRSRVSAYARENGLHWVDDLSNANTDYDRNYLRRRLVPVIAERWPQWSRTLGRAADHQSEAAAVMNQAADGLLKLCMGSDNTLDVAAVLPLNDNEKRLLLRRWLQQCGMKPPSLRRLRHLIASFLSGLSSSGGVVCWPGTEVRRYRNKLYAMEPLLPITQKPEVVWRSDTDLNLPQVNKTLSWCQLREQSPELAAASSLVVRLRCGGETYLHPGKKFHKPLKKLFQELGIPPWQRDRIPLIYAEGELRLRWRL